VGIGDQIPFSDSPIVSPLFRRTDLGTNEVCGSTNSVLEIHARRRVVTVVTSYRGR